MKPGRCATQNNLPRTDVHRGKLSLAGLHDSFDSTGMKSLIVSALLLIVVSTRLSAGEPKAPAQASPEFQRMKSLVSAWKGTADMGDGPKEFTVEYRVVSGGSSLEERVFAGTPKEMVTMYYDRKGKLGLTHYCMLGNRPGMLLKSADAKSIVFDFDPKCGVDAKSEMHMHALTITFEGADTINQIWKLYEDGKPKDNASFTLKRVKG